MLIRAADSIQWLAVDELVIVYRPAGHYFADLNHSASELWRRLVEESSTTDMVCDHLVHTYGMHRDQAVSTVVSFIDQLAGQRLITVVE